MEVLVLGCGDAFGSGGRSHACFQVTTPGSRFLVDCGASALISMRRHGVDPALIDAIFISHLHGDHFGGLPFFILDAQLVSRRTTPLTIAGPVGLRERLTQAMEVFFPGSWAASRKFELRIVEIEPGATTSLAEAAVTPFLVRHPSGAPALALRFEVAGKVFSYSGDTEWVDSLIAAGKDADLLIIECYAVDRQVKNHLDWKTLGDRLPAIGARRVLLTHLSAEALRRRNELGAECCEEGMTIAV